MVGEVASIKTIVEKESRVEALRERLLYPLKKRDPQGSDFWYLHPGESEADAEETAPIAVGFFSELNDLTDEREIQRLLTSKEWQQKIYGHYLNRSVENKPVMYLLLPTEDGAGRVPLVLPTEGGLRQRNIQTFAWGSAELETRLNRLRQGELPIATKALISIPLVERAFYQPIKTAKDLAHLLAEAARRIEQIIPKVYKSEEQRYPASEGKEGYLHKLLKSFQDELLPSLHLESENEKDYSFSDIYAQTIAYSLFTARVFSYVQDQRQGNPKETLFDRESAWQQLPETNPFLRRLFQDVSERSSDELGDELIGAIAEIFTILRAAKMDVILQDFREKQNREDIVIRFYEDFLAAYKPDMRERRGVYYTPEPVVSYMVKSVDVLLKEKFNKPLGLADPEVMILDPACGTGTFLLKICQIIYDRFNAEREAIVARVGDISWSEYVSDHLLPRIFGFELLMAPYAIAHLKLGLFLEETGYQFDSGKRLGVYLTNCLDQSLPSKPELGFQEFISQEGNAALEIKLHEPIMIIIGNPPYSPSIFEGDWIMNLMKQYKDGLNEKKSDLNREEWKFLRFAQSKLETVGQGIASFVINNTFIDAITLRGLRKSVCGSFDEIKILDLHGNIKRQEKCPDGSKDEGVFDIQQGVAVGTFIRCAETSTDSTVAHADIWGLKESKYQQLSANNILTTEWKSIKPKHPYFFLCNKNLADGQEFEDYWKIDQIFTIHGSGVKTDRDPLFIDLDKRALSERMCTFYSNECFNQEFIEAYRVEDSSSYNLLQRRRETKLELNHIRSILYRPFDERYIYYDPALTSRSAWQVTKHIIAQENLGLVFMRQVSQQEDYSHFLATSHPVDNRAFYSNRGIMQLAPLYLFPETDAEKAMGFDRYPNLSQPFLNDITAKLGYTPTPEAIFYYIYAIFHSPTYRSRYAEFLKIDFPRVPLTRSDTLFRQLAAYGEQLVALHLMKSAKLTQTHQHPHFVEQGGKCIIDPAHPKYEINTRSVIINKKGDRFTDIPPSVWNFYVGGYPVCAKWLKDRKGRTLSPADIAHYQQIVVALDETIKLMTAIDQAIPGFPIE